MGDGGDAPTVTLSTLYGDLEIRPFAKPKAIAKTDLDRYTRERAEFNKNLNTLRLRAQRSFLSETTLGHLTLGRTIGEGSFGRVLLCRPSGVTCRAKLQNYMALKIQKKDHIGKNKAEMVHVREERNLGWAFNCDHVTALIDYFQDKRHIYFILELCNAGELWSIIQSSRKTRLAPAVAKYWSAQVAMALEYMHNLDVIFRDLKPENLLVSHAGNMKLTDFGFAKRCKLRAWTVCGTPEYMAPEILRGQGYSAEVDWWAFGILVFEMNHGNPPFEAQSQTQLFKLITAGDVSYPSHFSKELIELISGFLVNNYNDRFGSTKHLGMDKIRKLPFYKGLSWDRLYEGTVKSPYVPDVSGQGDVSNFDEYDELPVKWYGSGQDQYGDLFTGF